MMGRMFLSELVTALDGARVPYALAGGMAMNVHGVPRLSYDVGLVVPLRREVLEALDAGLRGIGLLPRPNVPLGTLATGAGREKLLADHARMTVIFRDPDAPLREVDLFVNPPVDPDDVVAQAQEWGLGEQVVRVCSREHLDALSFNDLPSLERLSAYETMTDEAKQLWLDAWQAVIRELAAPVGADVLERRHRVQPLMPPKRSSPRRRTAPAERDSIREQLSVTQEEPRTRRRRKTDT